MRSVQIKTGIRLLLLSLSAGGAQFDVPGSPSDQYIGLNSSFQPVLLGAGESALLIGDDAFTYNKGDCAAILVFQLPDPGGEEIATANLSIYWDGDYLSSPGSGHPGSTDTVMPKWCDLYAIRSSVSNTVLTSDYGFKAVVGINDTLIQQQFIYSSANQSMNPVQTETMSQADAALAAWLNARFAAGARPGDFIFLRIHGQFDTGNPFSVSSANHSATNQRPVLTLVTGEIPPTAFFNTSPLGGTAPLTVAFEDYSFGTITNRFWDFGDGTLTNTLLTSLTHTYTSTGTFTVSLTVSGPAGTGTGSLTNLITVIAPVPPYADFTVSDTSGRIPLTVIFTDNSTGSITNRIWDFGDGTLTNTLLTSIEHTYTAVGTFTVSLTCDGLAESDTDIRPALIVTGEPLLPGMIEIFGHPADCTIGIDANGTLCMDWPGQPTVQCADDHVRYGRGESAAILVFQLPDIGTQTVSSASLSVVFEADYIQTASATYPADSILPKSAALYALRTGPDSAVLPGDYGFRSSIPFGNALIQEQFLVQPASRNAVPTPAGTSAPGRIALGGWIQSQYNNGARPGDCIFLRIHATFDSFSPFRIASADSASPPVLLISTGDNASDMPPPPIASLGGSTLSDPGKGVIRWTTVQGLGHVYSIWYSTNLLNDFQPLEINLPDTIQSWTNRISAPAVFYKIVAQ